ncbi:MAG TPA: hypothetical protein VNZ45_16560 [Bacteroidia bacterium]|jgi:hypothetical protein|nr:hypothetical protein [Bacteroidia bacterium]
MKTKNNILLFLPVLAILMPLCMQAQFTGMRDGKFEVYYTSADYIHGKKDPEYTRSANEKAYKQSEDIKDRKAGIKIRKLKAFAVKDNVGLTFRVNETYAGLYHYLVLDTGKIWLYVEDAVPIAYGSDLKVFSLSIVRAITNVGPGTSQSDMKFKKHVFISKGPDGELLGCDEGNMKSLMADDADIVAQIKDKGIAQGPYGAVEEKFNEDYTNVSAWISQYNQKHR